MLRSYKGFVKEMYMFFLKADSYDRVGGLVRGMMSSCSRIYEQGQIKSCRVHLAAGGSAIRHSGAGASN